MPRKKGTPKTGGRKKNVPNRTTREMRERIHTILDAMYPRVLDDLPKLDTVEHTRVFVKLLEFVTPKQREQKIDVSNLSDAEVDALLERAISMAENPMDAK